MPLIATRLLVLASICLTTWVSTCVQAREISFNRDIRPILSENCFVCHGPDKEQVAAGLRLDMRDSAVTEADSGEIPIVPGDAAESEVMLRLTSDDADVRMPPAESGKQLTAEQVELVRQWIDEGAPYDQHWAFVAPVRPDVPDTRNEQALNPIDHFIFDRLAREHLAPSKPAERTTLLRRVTLDLTGLPPTPSEISSFLADQSPDAYEKVVDRLLASPHYGERMTLPWLDHARYADSNGYQSDGSRDMWAWRDWVIDAFNRNLPFDQFTIEQLAGDMLPNATKKQIIATGFNRNNRLNGEGGRIVDEWFVETVIDRVETTGLTWLGLTFNCCRCHDHKYDPISQREFYQMFAYFNSVDESGVLAPNGKNGDNTPPVLELPTEEQTQELIRLDQVIQSAQQRVKDERRNLPAAIAAWESELRDSTEDARQVWEMTSPSVVKSLGGASMKRQEDGSYLAGGTNPASDTYEIEVPLDTGKLSALMIEVLPDPSLPTKSLGRAFNGNFVLTRVDATVTAPSLSDPMELILAKAAADFEQDGWLADTVQRRTSTSESEDIGSKPKKGWAPEGNKPENRVPRRIMFVADRQVEILDDALLKVVLRHESPYGQHNIGRFRLFTSSLPTEQIALETDAIPSEIAAVLAVPKDQRDKKQTKQLEAYFVEHVPNGLRVAEQVLETAKKERTAADKLVASTMVMKEGPPRDAFILERGEYDRPKKKVERSVPAVLPDLPNGVANDRLGLAKWIVDPSNPLTARVWVNRQWEQFFGVGIVKTSENFGAQAEYPVHPELLDWLAVEFMSPTVMPDVAGAPAQPWDMKAFRKMLVMSATYRQSSHVTPQLMARDPENRLLARGPRFRLSGELIRDSALASSGLLVSKIGGPSARPYMPAGVWDETSKYGNLRNYKHDQGDGLYRRTMYTIWKRTAAPPSMLIFDAPNREVCTIKRSRTNTPLQALSLLNEVTFVEASRGLAARMIREAGESAEERIAHGFQLAIGRQPVGQEMDILRSGLESDLKRFTEDTEAAKQLIAIGESSIGRDIDPSVMAAYTMTANVILNLDEFVTRE
ncbi:PSD1 and planctomycete cytochrome C domain-containing protein [Stieleria varia]|nr:PSD1 and planctomycete cytochrome C domain-containing protein [Stieleria varia]